MIVAIAGEHEFLALGIQFGVFGIRNPNKHCGAKDFHAIDFGLVARPSFFQSLLLDNYCRGPIQKIDTSEDCFCPKFLWNIFLSSMDWAILVIMQLRRSTISFC